jgi:hypothetical protein
VSCRDLPLPARAPGSGSGFTLAADVPGFVITSVRMHSLIPFARTD